VPLVPRVGLSALASSPAFHFGLKQMPPSLTHKFAISKLLFMKRLSKKALCGCESGKQYGDCCWNKKFRWVVNEQGEILRSVKVHPQVKRIANEQKKEFLRIFGREPSIDEPVMVNKLLFSEDQYKEGLTELFRQVGVDESILYATLKTGVTLVEGHEDLLTDAQIAEWQEAVLEFKKLKAERAFEKKSSIDRLFESYERLSYIYALIIWKKNSAREHINLGTNADPIDYVFLCLTKNLKTFRAFRTLLENRYGEDALSSIRSMYENYLQIIGSNNSGSGLMESVRANAGLMNKAFQVDPKDHRFLIEKMTKKKVKRTVSVFSLANKSPHKEDLKLYEVLYSRLSDYVHPSIMSIHSYFHETQFDYLKTNPSAEAVVYATFVNCMILHAIKNMNGIDELSRGDISNYLKQVCPLIEELFEEDNSEFSSAFKQRVMIINKTANV
jgi:hypothetical protein